MSISLTPPPRNAGARFRQSKILGPNGKPVATWLYPSPRWNLRQYKPRYWLTADTKSNFGEYDRYEAVNYARQLRAQIGDVGTAIVQKNDWAFGDAWDAHYTGTNAKWGEEAANFLKYQFYPLCNLRGPLYHMKKTLWLSGAAWDTDGDDAMILTETSGGFPAVALIPATRIGRSATGGRSQINPEDNLVKGGLFDGAKIFDGIVMNRDNRCIAVQVVDSDGKDQYIPSYSIDLGYDPEWSDQGRGIPRLARCLLRWMNLQDIDEFLQRGMKRATAVGLKFKTIEGEPLGNELDTPEDDPNTTQAYTGRKVAYEEIEGGEAYYFRAGSNEDVEALNYANPHPNVENFIARIKRECLASLGWFYELLNLESTGRAPSRILCKLARQSIWSRQGDGYRRWKRMIGYAIAKAMKNGYLSRNNDGMDPYLWEPGFPAELSSDEGNDEDADRKNLILGTTSKTIIAQKHGWHRQEIRKQRLDEVGELLEDAKAISQKYPQVPFEKAMELLEQRGPNPTPAPAEPKEAPAPEEKQ